MQEEFYKKLEAVLSEDRLSAYGKDDPGRCIVMARYLWNMAICESLYSPLQMFEVALRNAIHRAWITFSKVDTWYDSVPLAPWGHKQVGGAKQKISTSKPVTPGRVVAELHFGFWTSMFESHYELKTDFLPGGIKKVFPELVKSLHRRKFIKGRLDKIRHLRNRVFHHERIIHWKDLTQQHADIIEALGWISPELAEMAQKLDRFLEIHKAGIDPWIAKLRNYWPASSA